MSAPRDVVAHPAHPERVCWGCERYCPADALGCANGSERSMHPSELFGDDWMEWIAQREASRPPFGKK